MMRPNYSNTNNQNRIQIIDLGLSNYNEAWTFQKKLFEKVTNERQHNYLILTEHPPVITVGKNADENNIITNPHILKDQKIDVVKIDRGGDVTFHGPGQIVGYPIINLNNFKKDIHWYLRSIEEVIIRTLEKFGITSERIKDLTGVWVDNKKICAIGIKVTRWVTMHGFALNVSTQLDYFNHIIPCGINNKSVTSIQHISDQMISIEEVKNVLCESFKSVFSVEIEKREYGILV